MIFGHLNSSEVLGLRDSRNIGIEQPPTVLQVLLPAASEILKSNLITTQDLQKKEIVILILL